MTKIFTTFAVVALCCICGPAHGQIAFTDNYWSTTFDCADWLTYSDTLNCDGLSKGGNNTDSAGNWEKVWSTSNMAAGGGGKGNRWYFQPEKNDNSGGIIATFPSRQTEFWVRLYARWSEGTTLAAQQDLKMVYPSTDGYNFYVSWPYGSNASRIVIGGTGIFYADGGGWASVFSGGVSDETWHCFEMYFKISGANDGIFRMWVDGVLINEATSIDWDSYNIALNGALAVPFHVNHDYFTPAGWLDYDDIAIALPGYTGFVLDAANNPMIGPIGYGGSDTTAPVVTISTTSPQNITADSLAISGTASDEVGVTQCKYRIGSTPNASYGTALTGTTSWSGTATGFTSGANTLYVGCSDAAGNWGGDSITVNYTPAMTTILFDGFESGTDANWRCDYSQGGSSVVASSPSPFAGTYSLRQPYDSPGNLVHGFGDHPGCASGSLQDDITVEYYIYYPAGSWANVDTKMFILNAFQAWDAGCSEANNSVKPHTWAPYYMSISVDSSGQPFGQLTRSDGLVTSGYCRTDVTDGALWTNFTQNQGTPVALQQDVWEKVKFRLKLNTPGSSDGIFQIWINDVLKASYTTINFRGQYTDFGLNHLIMSFDQSSNEPIAYVGRDNVHIFTGAAPTLTIPGGVVISGGRVE